MKSISIQRLRAVSTAVCAGICLLSLATGAGAEESVRQQKFEIFGVSQWTTSGKISNFRFSNNFVGGLGLGYNFTDQINVNTDVMFSRVNLASQGTGARLDANHIAAHVNLDYYLFKSALTPFLTGGVGVDSYDGSQGITAISKTELSYKVGGGLRWDLSKRMFAKGLYRAAWADIHKTDSAHTIALMLGVKF
ncbi:MAG: hypothetical protein B9S33_09440 [Pedosphaera sp. Tous-C6FEB]|nr:MAG: hypothetical protein B9S33_09440 [Pedosphaera sp. Tous-C6FEB]